MDDLKLFAKNEKEIDSLVQTVRIFSDGIGITFGLEKCAAMTMKRGKRYIWMELLYQMTHN